MATRSPGFTFRTADPTETMVPADSWPRTMGSFTTEVANGAVHPVVHIRAADAGVVDGNEDIVGALRWWGRAAQRR